MGKHFKYLIFSLLLGLIYSFSVFAADGQLSFSDPSGNVGENITLNMKLRSDVALSRADVTLRYDSNALQFVSGTDADGGAGTVRVHGAGTQGENNSLVYTLQFKALSAGSFTISVEKQEVYSQDESLLNLTHVGSSKVTISGGETTAESSASSESESSTAESGGQDKETVNEGVKLTAKDKSITIMNPGADVKIPDGFLESTIDVDGHQVKGWVWKAESDHQYIILYGMNDAGDLSFYRYDLKEKTIQRYFQDPLEEEQKKNAESYPALLAKYDKLVGKYNLQFILSCVFGFSTLLLLVGLSFLWKEKGRLKRIIAFQKDGFSARELRPSVEEFSTGEGFEASKERADEDKEEQTKMIPSLQHDFVVSDLEEDDLGATRSISLKVETGRRDREDKEAKVSSEKLPEKKAAEKEEGLDKEEGLGKEEKEVELEIEDL